MPPSSPADRSIAQHVRFRQLELNAQIVRFPSGQEPQFGGQAVYLMRIFGIDGDRIAELPLENTPDVARLSQDAALKAELAAYVRDNAQAIDQGVYMIPDKLLARKAISYSTFGNARQVNHPFSPLLSPQDLAGARSFPGQPGALARGAAGAAGQRHLPGLPPVGRHRRLPLHRPRRQVHLAAQPHRGGDFAAFPRRAAAPRRLRRCGCGRARAEPVQAAVVRAAGQLGRRRRLPMPMPTSRCLA